MTQTTPQPTQNQSTLDQKIQIYNWIEEKVHLRGNSYYVHGDDPTYHFEPGTTMLPTSLGIVYNPNIGNASLKFDSPTKDFYTALNAELKTHGIKTQSIDWKESSQGGYQFHFVEFSRDYKTIATILNNLIDPHRFFLPNLAKPSKSQYEDNDEYTLKTKYGALWLSAYVCHGANYQLTLGSIDLAEFDDFKQLRKYADQMVKIQQALRRHHLNNHVKHDSKYHDIVIELNAESEQKIRHDLATIVNIVTQNQQKKKHKK